jgi:predicted Zn-dependent protease with MMP-like domain
VQNGDSRPVARPRIRRRDRHGRGLRGVLAPPGVPLRRTRAERFDDLVLQAVARLEARWEAQLAGVEFGVEEIPPPDVLTGTGPGPVPLARLDPGSQRAPAGLGPDGLGADGLGAGGLGAGGRAEPLIPTDAAPAPAAAAAEHKPPRIVVYRRPLLARSDSEEELGELVFDVVVEEFAQLLGIDPEDVDPGYSGGE